MKRENILKLINVLMVLVIIGLVIALCLKGNTIPSDNGSDLTTPADTDEAPDVTTEEIQQNSIPSYKPTLEEIPQWAATLDAEYSEAYECALSNVDKNGVRYDYADKWLEYATQYYNLIMSTYGDKLFCEIMSMEDFIKYKDQRVSEAELYWSAVYMGGTATAQKTSLCAYELCRERALELYQMYLDIDFYFTEKDRLDAELGTGDG